MRRKHYKLVLLMLLILMEFGILPEIQSIGFYCGDPKISHKFIGDTVSVKVLLSSTLLLPLITMWAVEYTCHGPQGFTKRGGGWWSWCSQSAGWYREYLSGYLIVFFLTCVGKMLVGEPRPHFLDTCRPYQAINCTSGYVATYTCTNKDLSEFRVRDASKSFPSGHASLALYLFTYTAWYLQARMVVVSSLLVAWLQVLCLVWSLVCAVTRVTDHRHHWWDVLAGSVLGATVAIYTVKHFCFGFQIGSYRNLNTAVVNNTEVTNDSLYKNDVSSRRFITDSADITSQNLTNVSPCSYLLNHLPK